MINNTEKFAKTILLNSRLNLILGTAGSGKSELCTFLHNVCKRDNIKSINYEEYSTKIEDATLERLASTHKVIFINNDSLTIFDVNNINQLKNQMDFLNLLCNKYGCTFFITDYLMKKISHLPNYIEKDETSKSLVYSRMFDNILTINKITNKETPFFLRVAKKLFGLRIPNAIIKFIKCRQYDKNKVFYLHFDQKNKMYYDINKNNFIIKLFYDF